jgi:hypothetical protein
VPPPRVGVKPRSRSRALVTAPLAGSGLPLRPALHARLAALCGLYGVDLSLRDGSNPLYESLESRSAWVRVRRTSRAPCLAFYHAEGDLHVNIALRAVTQYRARSQTVGRA